MKPQIPAACELITAARNDLEGTVAFYADDAVLLPPNAPIAKPVAGGSPEVNACGLVPINALVLTGLANFGLVDYTESPTYDP